MFSSSALSLLFTVLFVITGGYSLVRLAELGATPDTGGSRVTELSHLLMSVAMIAMTWAWSGGSGTAGGVVEIVVFGVLTVWFLARWARRDRRAQAFHVVMNGAMVWMVAAVPLSMGRGMGDATAADTPGWVRAVSWIVVVLLVAAALTWARRLLRREAGAPPEPVAAPVREGATVTATLPDRVRVRGPELDCTCHLLMSLGMAGMLLAML